MPLPKKWQRFFVGRKVIHPNRSDLEGVVKYAASTRLGQQNSQGEAITAVFCVEWSDGTSQVMEDTEVAAIAIDEFVKEEWVLDRILKLQECGWDEAKADAAMADVFNRPASSAGVKFRTKGPAKSKTGGPATGTKKAGPSTNAICVSLQDLKRKAASPDGVAQNRKKSRSSLPVVSSPSQVAKKAPKENQKQQQQQQQSAGTSKKTTATTKGKSISKALDHISTNDAGPSNGAVATGGAKTTAASPRKVIHPNSVAPGGRNRGTVPPRILSPLLHVSALSFAKVRGKPVYQYDEVHVDGKKYRVYNKNLIIPSSKCFRATPSDGKPADMTIDTWKIRGKCEESDEYLVDCIVAHRRTNGADVVTQSRKSTAGPSEYEYLLKYTRYELDPGEESWLKYEDVADAAAYDTWVESGCREWIEGMRAVRSAAGLE